MSLATWVMIARARRRQLQCEPDKQTLNTETGPTPQISFARMLIEAARNNPELNSSHENNTDSKTTNQSYDDLDYESKE